MIPKIIHYCWLSDDPFPSVIQQCIDSWKKNMPDYTIKRWSTANFDISSVQLVREAYAANKYAFAADYIRCYALYTEGGIYLDSDVIVHKDLTELLDGYDYVSAIEFHPPTLSFYKKQIDENFYRKPNVEYIEGVGLQAAFMASVPKHPFMKKCISDYNKLTLNQIVECNILAPIFQVKLVESYGFKYKNETQKLDKNIILYSTAIIGQSKKEIRGRYATHRAVGSWVKKNTKEIIISFLCDLNLYHSLLMVKETLLTLCNKARKK